MIVEIERVPPSLKENKGVSSVFQSVVVVGARGQTGRLFADHLSRVARVEPVVRENGAIERALATGPEAVILATPNPVDEVLKEIAEHVRRPTIFILPQNGVDIVPKAQTILADCASPITLVRAGLWTNVSRDQNGNIIYNPKKNRIALAAVGSDQNDSLIKAQNTFAQAGFDVRVAGDYRSLEWTKLLVNLWGSTSTITGLSPARAFLDPQIYNLELRALKDRLRILEAAGIQIADNLWSIGRLRWLAQVQKPIAFGLLGITALVTAKERNNQPPAAARQITQGAKSVEATNYYHKPIIELGAQYNLRSPVDEAVRDTLQRHEKINGTFSLTLLGIKERRRLLQSVFGYETKAVFVDASPNVRRAAESVYKHFRKDLQIRGADKLGAVAEVLDHGQSVVVAPRHLSNADHTAIMEALEKSLPEEARKYPIYIVAGMKFGKEFISAVFSRAYPHPIVHTLAEGDSEEVRWRAQIINRRANKKINELLEQPCIMVVYLEGGRSQEVKNGKVQLQQPALGSSVWLTNPRVGLVVPTNIAGTEKMLPYGKLIPRSADITVEFCDPITAATLKKEEAKIRRVDRDQYLSGMVMRAIAAKLSPDERGDYVIE